MKNVSCGLVCSHLDFLKSIGVNEVSFLRTLADQHPQIPELQPAYLRNPRHQIPWDHFATFLNALEPYFGNEKTQERFFEHSSRDSGWVPWQMIARLITSPTMLYQMFGRHVVPITFGDTLSSSIEVLQDGRVHIKMSVPPTSTPSELFFSMSKMGLKKMPMLIGLGDSVVEGRWSAFDGEYFVTPPPSSTLWRRVSASVRLWLFPRSAFADLARQEKQIREDHARLMASESELRSVRADVELRVQERLSEILSGESPGGELAHPPRTKAVVANASAGRRPTILVVEDEVELLSLLAETLDAYGFNAITACDADEALALFQQLPVDLVLTDFAMPRISGVELGRRLRALNPKVPIVLCTGHGDLPARYHGDDVFTSAIIKPLDTRTLIDCIRAALES